MPLELSLILISVILVICIASIKITNKIGIPTLLIFILLGMLFGSDGPGGIGFDDFMLTEKLCTIALIFIMFYGGFGTNLKQAKKVLAPAALLSTGGVVITTGLTGLFCTLVFKMSLLEGLLVGAVISSTDAASVFSILRGKQLNLKNSLASLLEVESGSNDPMSYMLTTAILSAMSAAGEMSVISFLFEQIFYGLLFGVLMGAAASVILRRFSFEIKGLHEIFVVAIALFSYAIPVMLGGNGFLSIYITGIILGNTKILHKVSLVHFFDGITWLMQIMLFFVLGLLAFPSQLFDIAGQAILIAVFLVAVARPIAGAVILSWFKIPLRQQMLVSWAGLRGAASIAFAINVMTSGVGIKYDIFHIVFFAALISVGLQGSLLPLLAKKLDLIDEENTVSRTFNDYQDDTDARLVELPVSDSSSFVGRTLLEISLPDDILVVMIKRGTKTIIPRGSTKINKDDVLVLNGEYSSIVNMPI